MAATERRRGAKYMEGYLEFKESSKWVTYWVVIRGSQLFFFKDTNTHITENIQGHVDIGPNSSFASGKNSKGKFEFEVKTDRQKKYLFRASSELLRLQWVHTLGLAAQGKTPPPLFVANPEAIESKNKPERKISSERNVSNEYTEVPEFNISSDVIGEVTEKEMQKTLVKKHNSFSSHCKKIWGRKKPDTLSKSLDAEEQNRRPVSEGAEAVPEALYDACTFPGDKPPWYFGKMKRDEAEKILERKEPGRFLVRDSETVKKPGAYTLSLRHRDKCRHHKIETLPDDTLVIKGHEDKSFSNLTKLMSYFVKSQEKDINLIPICQEQGEASPPPSNEPIQQQSYEKMDPKSGARPPVPGCEDKSLPENGSGSVSPRQKVHGYENLPDKPRAKPPLKSRATEPVLPSYQNLPPKAGNRSPPMHVHQPESYEPMSPHGGRNSFEEEPKPSLPPRRPANTPHGYENLPEKAAAVPLPPRQPTGEGYVNLPAKSRSSSDPPPSLPPRSQRQNPLGYENVPSSGRGVPSPSQPYQNVPPQAPSRHSHSRNMGLEPTSATMHNRPPMKRSTTLPAHIIENTLGKMSFNEDPL